MRTYSDLTELERKHAFEKCVEDILNAIVEGALRFNDELNKDDLQKRIDAAFERTEKRRTPWFAHEYIMDTCREEIEGMAQCDAENALYHDGTQKLIFLRN